MEAPEDVEKAIRKSKIKYDRHGNLVDVRYQKDIKAYQEWQVGNRQLNREMLEFQRMQEHYAKKKQPAPYTTLAGFRRARRAQAQSYKDSRKEWNKSLKEENKQSQQNLMNYKIPSKQLVRQEKDAEKWKQYDADYAFYEKEEPSITKDVDEISGVTGLPLIGREYRIKSKASYDRKVNDKRLQGDYKPIGDVVRYTFEHKKENAAKDIRKTLAKFEQKGYTIVAIDNKWKANGVYKGVNVDIISPNGVPMEVQFLTKQNHWLKEIMHNYYEIARDSKTPEHIKKLAEEKMRQLAELWEEPDDIEEL